MTNNRHLENLEKQTKNCYLSDALKAIMGKRGTVLLHDWLTMTDGITWAVATF